MSSGAVSWRVDQDFLCFGTQPPQILSPVRRSQRNYQTEKNHSSEISHIRLIYTGFLVSAPDVSRGGPLFFLRQKRGAISFPRPPRLESGGTRLGGGCPEERRLLLEICRAQIVSFCAPNGLSLLLIIAHCVPSEALPAGERAPISEAATAGARRGRNPR
jgi:hypothetical protein